METTDPFLWITAAATVAVLLTPLASRLIGQAASALSAELDSSPGPELSRIRRRSHI